MSPLLLTEEQERAAAEYDLVTYLHQRGYPLIFIAPATGRIK